jgi:iron complex outermembrane receptor protein
MKTTSDPIKSLLRKGGMAWAAIMLAGMAVGQADTTTVNALEGLSLKDLLDVKIVSVSKKSESLFGAPLSASVVTKEEIERAGCTSIMEALRLVPGMIVRETTNGNYDVQMRGVYSGPNPQFDGNSVTSLVMIDGRPIFNYFKGGTFWETLPVDLNDVEKIEVVRGPSGALYGPNAVAGVINIITRQIADEGFYAVANSRQGSFQTFINNASLGYRSKKWSAIVSGNYQHRNRTQSSLYEFMRDQWFNEPEYMLTVLGDTVEEANKIYFQPRLAMEKYAGNIFVNYESSKNTAFHLSAGIQHSSVHKVFGENGVSPLTNPFSDSRYADLQANIAGFNARVSYVDGTQGPTEHNGDKYDFQTVETSVEYNITRGNFSFKPGYAYRSAVYDDTKYSDTAAQTGMFNSRGRITLNAFSLRAEYNMPGDKWRFVAGISNNTFNYPDETNLSYQLAATWKMKKKHLLRAVISRTPRSSNIYDTYVHQHISFFPSGYRKYTQFQLEGYKDLTLLTAFMGELGYRGRIADGLDIDVELFGIESKNYSMNVINRSYVESVYPDTVEVIPLRPTNLPLKAFQQGVTVSLTWATGSVRVKPFITVQQTTVKNYAPYANTPDASSIILQTDPSQYNIFSGMGQSEKLKSAPAVFGGLSANYAASSKFNINLNSYYYSAHNISHATIIVFHDGVRGMDRIPAKLIVNANLSYEAIKGLHLTLSGKNLLNDKSREFFKMDPVPFMLVGGLQYSF